MRGAPSLIKGLASICASLLQLLPYLQKGTGARWRAPERAVGPFSLDSERGREGGFGNEVR